MGGMEGDGGREERLGGPYTLTEAVRQVAENTDKSAQPADFGLFLCNFTSQALACKRGQADKMF